MFLPLRGTSHDPAALPSTASCELCHPGTSFKQFVCVTCHTPAQTDPIHVASLVPAYVPGAVTSADCYRCHPSGAGMDPKVHAAYFPIGTAAHPATCRTCHIDPVSRTDPTKVACLECHSRAAFVDPAILHARVRDYPAAAVTSVWCLRCHASGQVDRIASHGKLSVPGGEQGGGGPGDGQHDTRCFTCHTMTPPLFGGNAAGVAGRPWAQNWRQASCASCH